MVFTGSGWEFFTRISNLCWCFTLLLLYINGLLDDVICNIAIYADDTVFYSKCVQIYELLQQLELVPDLEFDLVDFSAGKTQLVLFDKSSNTCTIDLKMNGFVF